MASATAGSRLEQRRPSVMPLPRASEPPARSQSRSLEAAGLVTGEDDGPGARRRRSYEVTAAGRAALAAWLTAEHHAPLEMRDRTLLRAFFATVVPPRDARQILAETRRRAEAMVADFDARILPAARRHEDDRDDPFPRMVAECGRAVHTAIAAWAAHASAELRVDSPEDGP